MVTAGGTVWACRKRSHCLSGAKETIEVCYNLTIAVCRQQVSVSVAGCLTTNSSTSLFDALQLLWSQPQQHLANVAHHESNKCQHSTKKMQSLDFVVMRATITTLYSSPGGDKPPAWCYSHSKYLMMSVYEMEAMQGLKSMAWQDIIHQK